MILLKYFFLGLFTSLMYPPFFLLPLGFLIFPYLVKLLASKLYEKSILNFFLYGFSYGFGFLIIYLSWIRNPFLVYENTEPYAILSILLPIFLSIFFGLGFIIFKYLKDFFNIILVTPLVFILIEFLISNFYYGFPWISNSYILSNNLFGFYLIKYFGTLTSGFLTISFLLLPTFFLYDVPIYKFIKYSTLFYGPLLFIIILFIFYYSFNEENNYKELTIEAYQILTPIKNSNKKDIEHNLLNIINNSESEYIIFAENNYPYLLDKKNLNNIVKFIKNEKKVIIGATTFENDKYYNSFVLLEKNQILFFDKKILVPFGEFLPLRNYLRFMEFISGDKDFKKGERDRVLITKDNVKILPIICYEIIFDKIFKNVDKHQIDFMINITNDSWFGNKIGPYQHFYITRIKSLIANKPLVRVSNNGISSIIYSNGYIAEFTQLNQKSKLTHNLTIKNKMNYYYVHKLSFYYLLFIYFLILIIIINKKNEKKL